MPEKLRRPALCLALWGALLAALTLTAPQGQAQSAASSATQPVWAEETIFLGEAVPLRHEGRPLAQACREALGGGEGELSVAWASPQGPRELGELGRQRPKTDQTYRLSACLRGTDGRERRKELLYRVRVESGAVLVRVEGRNAPLTGTALFRLRGQGLTLYSLARPEADPMGGPPALEAEFTGLPYGVYTVTAMEGSAADEQTCALGLCQEDDTVDPARRHTVLRFEAAAGPQRSVGQSYRLRAEP